MNESSILADVNVWLATLVENHPHHERARRWWMEDVLPDSHKVAFCRVTQLALLRLLTNAKVMGEQKRTLAGAWSDYRQMLDQQAVLYADEPKGIDKVLAAYCQREGSSPNFWTDAYLAAFVEAGESVFATFDQGFRRFPRLRLTLLS